MQCLLFLAKANRYGPLFAVAIFTGLRQGELVGLRWQDVDLEASASPVRFPLGSTALAPPPRFRSAYHTRLRVSKWLFFSETVRDATANWAKHRYLFIWGYSLKNQMTAWYLVLWVFLRLGGRGWPWPGKFPTNERRDRESAA